MDSSTESLFPLNLRCSHKMRVPLGCLKHLKYKKCCPLCSPQISWYCIFSWVLSCKHSTNLPSPELEKLRKPDDLDLTWSGCWHIVLDREDSGAYGRKRWRAGRSSGYSDFQRPVCPWLLIFGRLWNSLILKSLLKVQNDKKNPKNPKMAHKLCLRFIQGLDKGEWHAITE